MIPLIKQLKGSPSWCWVVVSGILLGLNAPGRHTQILGMISLFPLFLVLDRIHANQESTWKRKFGRILAACWGTGSIAALIGTSWITYASQVFGQLPWVGAVLITGLGYGFEVTLVLFICFGIPMLIIRRRGWWDIPVRLSFFLIIEPFCPRLFNWTFGGLTFAGFPWISQIADVIGSSGLGIFSIGFSLLLVIMWRWKVEHLPIPLRAIRGMVILYLLLWCIGFLYGVSKVESLKGHLNEGAPLHVIALQPNFSFQQLRSNAMDYFAKERSLRELLRHSIQAINESPENPSIPRLVIWPESAYPSAYFKDVRLQPLVRDFSRRYRTSILFNSVDWDETLSGRRFYGIAVLMDSNGEVKGRYNKIFRMPFGEYIPGARIFPSYARWVRKHIANLSEYQEGEEFTVLNVSDELQVCAPICFDALSPAIIRNMARNGAKLVINISNLIWFGNTNASDQLEMTLRWKAIENRVPIFLLSNNGESLLIDALGTDVGKRLGLFEKGYLDHTIFLKQHSSIYREYARWIYAIIALLFIVLTMLGTKHGRIFHKE